MMSVMITNMKKMVTAVNLYHTELNTGRDDVSNIDEDDDDDDDHAVEMKNFKDNIITMSVY